MIPFTAYHQTDDGRSYGPEIEVQCEVEIDGGKVDVRHIWTMTSKLQGRRWIDAGSVDLLDPDTGADAYRNGLAFKAQAEADADWCDDIKRNASEAEIDEAADSKRRERAEGWWDRDEGRAA